MKIGYKAILGVMAVFALANCKASGELNDDGDVIIKGSKRISNAIEYSHGGWFPGPNSKNFELIVKVKITEDGKALASAETPLCKATANVDLARYDELEKLILNAEYYEGQAQGADMGDEKLVVHTKAADLTYFLRQGDGSYNQPIIVAEEASVIRAKVQRIAEIVFDKADCDNSEEKIAQIYIRQNVNLKVEGSAELPFDLHVTKLLVKFSGNKVILNGTHQTVSNMQICTVNFQNRTVTNPQLSLAAQKVSVVHNGAVCDMMAQYYLPGVSNLSDRSYEISYTGATPSEIGYLSCATGSQLRDTAAFEKELAKYTAKSQSACVNR